MELYFLRHGEAEPKRPEKDATDADRTLNETGRREIAKRAEWLSKQGIRFDRILTSPLRRTVETARIVSETMGLPNCVEEVPILAPGVSSEEFFHGLEQYQGLSSILLVGHQPDLGRHIAYGVFGRAERGLRLETGGLCWMSLEKFPPQNLGEIRCLIND